MVGQSKAKGKKSQEKKKKTQKERKQGPTSALEGQKRKSLVELHGTAKLVIQTSKLDHPLSPQNSLQELQK